jgi:hypothetical protein
MAKTIITLTTTQENDTVITQQIENEKDIKKTHTVIDDLAAYLPIYEREFDKANPNNKLKMVVATDERGIEILRLTKNEYL